MFTGIIERVGTVVRVASTARSAVVTVDIGPLADGTTLGDSICVNGVCLTLTGLQGAQGAFDVMPETFRRSSLRTLQTGDQVNLERALAVGDRLGGHIVQGHVDGIGTVAEIARELDWLKLYIKADSDLMSYMITKGSIAIDGVSLTVVDVAQDRFSVALIPTTLSLTTLMTKKVGDVVNLEIDIINKWIKERLDAVIGNPAGGSLTMDRLREQGFA